MNKGRPLHLVEPVLFFILVHERDQIQLFHVRHHDGASAIRLGQHLSAALFSLFKIQIIDFRRVLLEL